MVKEMEITEDITVKDLQEFLKEMPQNARVDIAYLKEDHLKCWMPPNKVELNESTKTVILWYIQESEEY